MLLPLYLNLVISNFKLNQPGYQLMTLFNKSSHLGLTGQPYKLFTRNNKTLVEIFSKINKNRKTQMTILTSTN